MKVVWCGGRPAKLVKYFYSKWMWRLSIPLGCLMVTLVDMFRLQNTSVMAMSGFPGTTWLPSVWLAE